MADFEGDDYQMGFADLDEAQSSYNESEGFHITRKQTTIEREALKRKETAAEYVRQLPTEITMKEYLPSQLSGAIFCGHLVTDLDSIAGSIGAAELYGGLPARASEVNSETEFALNYWGAKKPEPIETLLKTHPEAGVCLVDHQQTSQLNKSIDVARIVGVIDHHALQNATIVTDMPIYIDIRPWGSMSSIITHSFLTLRRRPTRATAGMLLCAILSDTLNLQSPTTTEWDRLMVAILVQLLGIEDVQYLASQQFKAKSSELGGLSAKALVTGDQKVFTYKTDTFDGAVAFAVVETTDDEVILNKTPELLVALSEDKEQSGVSLSYLAVVNIVELKTHLLLCGPNERSLAGAAYSAGTFIQPEDHSEPYLMNLGKLVSRKKDFIPAISAAIKKGWSGAPAGRVHSSQSDIFDFAKYQDSSLASRTPFSGGK